MKIGNYFTIIPTDTISWNQHAYNQFVWNSYHWLPCMMCCLKITLYNFFKWKCIHFFSFIFVVRCILPLTNFILISTICLKKIKKIYLYSVFEKHAELIFTWVSILLEKIHKTKYWKITQKHCIFNQSQFIYAVSFFLDSWIHPGVAKTD